MLTTAEPTNTIALAGERGIVVVDTSVSPTLASKIRELIVEQFGRADIFYLINTHSHLDHVGGNEAFADTLIIGHENCPAGISEYTNLLPVYIEGEKRNIARLEAALAAADEQSEQATRMQTDLAFAQLRLSEWEKDAN